MHVLIWKRLLKMHIFFSILNVIKGAYFCLTGYPAMQFYMNKTGHPMVFSCEWPLYENGQHIKVGTDSYTELQMC